MLKICLKLLEYLWDDALLLGMELAFEQAPLHRNQPDRDTLKNGVQFQNVQIIQPNA